MTADRDDLPTPRPREAEEIDLEVVDDAPAGPAGDPVSMQDFMKMGPDMVSQLLRTLMLQKLKQWFIRNLVIFTVLALLASEYKWARWVMSFWFFIAGMHLAVLVFGWYMGNKQAAKLTQMMKGFAPPPGGGTDLR